MKTPTPPTPRGNWCVRYPGDVVEINPSVWFVDNDGYRVVGQGFDTPLYRFALEDKVQLSFVAVALRLGGLVRQHEIAAAFGHSEETQRRWERRYERDGMDGLRSKKGSGRPRQLTATHERSIQKWFRQGLSNCEMANRLGISESTIRHSLRRLGLRRERIETEPALLFAPGSQAAGGAVDSRQVAAQCEVREEEIAQEVAEDVEEAREPSATAKESETPPIFPTTVSDPMDRSLDRVCAAIGMLDDADPAFAEIDHLPRLGVLVAIPLLVQSGVLGVFQRIYGTIGPAFYGLRTTVVCLFLFALLRIKRPENLKEHNAQELGRLLGLDRAPEVKTLRRKLDRLSRFQRGMILMRALAELRAKDPTEALGTLYVDGHVKEYHGRYATGKAFVTRRRLAAPGATDTWVNDLNGDPFFVVQSETNEGLTQTLEPILAEIQQQVGAERSITVVFDRGGWSSKLFHRLVSAGYHLITYRKGHFRRPAPGAFEKRTLQVGEETFDYELHDAPRVRVGKSGNRKGAGLLYLWMRQVTRRREDGGQVAVITSRRDLPAERVLYLMFNRWRQENFFKYMKQEFALDALLQYGFEPLSEDQDRPNPAVRKLDQQIRKARVELEDAQRALGELLGENRESVRRTVRGFKIANSKATRRVETATQQADKLKQMKAGLPKRIPAGDLVKLKRDRNLIADAIKMSAYRIESQLYSLLEESYARCTDEGRTLLHALFQSSGRIELAPDELRITLARQSSPHRSRAVQHLCEKLTEMGVDFPGSKLRLSLAVEAHEPAIISPA